MADFDDVPRQRTWRIQRGDDSLRPFRVSTVIDGHRYRWDLTGYTGEAVVRRDYNTEPALGEATVTIDPDQTDGGNKGVYTVAIPDTLSADLPPTCFMDVTLIDGDGNRSTVNRFKVSVQPHTNYEDPEP